ncbi:MAG TPA: hypothetical protein H9740_01830 [Candidatus Hungatella pullicola]|nr:hypothetical protein [Candidatus Hungatella pullicola]
MDWDAILKIGVTIIVSFGGAGAIIAGVVKFAVNEIANSLQKKYELKLSKELEDYKTVLGNKSYVSKTRFDAEFEIYRELSGKSANMVKEVSQLFPSFTRDSRDDYDTYKKRYDTALDTVVAFQDALASNAPFISSEVQALFRSLELKCKTQLGDFVDFRLRPDAKDYVRDRKDEYKAVWKRTKDIQEELDSIIQNLREYLGKLEVIN